MNVYDREGRPMTTAAIWKMRARHPEWWPRLIRNAARTRILWHAQGRPRDMPVVTDVGRLIADSSGRGQLNGWGFDFRYHQGGNIRADDLWDRLSAMYPVERSESLPESRWRL